MDGDAATGSGTGCIDDLTAVQFVEGRLAAAVRDRVVAHLESCADCDALVTDLLASADEPEARTFDARPPGRAAKPVRDHEGGKAPARDEAGTLGTLDTLAAAALPRLPGYQIHRLLARGGMGEIYRATEIELSREVAIKIPRGASAMLLRRFEREVAITARLQHPGIVPVHGAGKLEDGTPFYVMRFVEGQPLDAAVGACASRDERLALVSHLVSVAETMAYVHGEGIVHRDLKPNNVLLGKFGAVVIDWGLAKQLDSPGAPRMSRADLSPGGGAPAPIPPTPRPAKHVSSGATTHAGDVLGTPAFMAPEQAAGELADRRADVYALGTMLAYVVGGGVPRPGTAIDWSGRARSLEPVYARSTTFDASERFADAGAFATALKAALAAPADGASTMTTLPATPAASPPRRWGLVAGIGALALAALGAGAFALSRARGTTTSTAPAPGVRLEPLRQTRTDIASFALSPSGTRLGYASEDRLEVRDLVSGRTWTRPAWIGWPRSLDWESDDTLVYASRMQRDAAAVHRVRWDLKTEQAADLGAIVEQPPAWVGKLDGDRALLMSLEPTRPRVIDASTSTETPVGAARLPVALFAIAPDRRRFVFADPEDRVSARIRVSDLAGTTIDSPILRDLTALTWETDDTLLFATGSTGHGVLWRARVSAAGLAAPTRIGEITGADQWIGGISARGGKILVSVVTSRFEAHWLERVSGRVRALPANDSSAALGWLDATTLATWNQTTHAVEHRGIGEDALPEVTGVRIDGDPANATRAGDTWIVARRDEAGRRVIAVDETGQVRWQTAPGELWFVRCAGDVAPPCVAGARTARGLLELRAIDPATGALGAVVAPEANIADAAIDRGGTQLAWLVDNTHLHTRALAGAGDGTRHPAFLGSAHSLAFEGSGTELLVAGNMDGRGIYRVGGDGQVRRVHGIDGSIVSLIRSSPDASRISYRVRVLSTQLAEVHPR